MASYAMKTIHGSRRCVSRVLNACLFVAITLGVFSTSATADVRVYSSQASFFANSGPLRTLDFSGGPLSITPSAAPYSVLYDVNFGGVCFQRVFNHYNLVVYTYPNVPMRVNLPARTYAVGFGLANFYGAAGTYTITLSSGESYQIPRSDPTRPYDYFGVVSDAPIEWFTFAFDGSYPTIWGSSTYPSLQMALTASAGSVTSCPAPADTPPIANAGADFSANEGQMGLTLNGSLSNDLDGDTLTYAWEQVVDGGPLVQLSGADTAQPTFTAPSVALGGETLSFQLTVTANGKSSTDMVSVTVVNVNHPPVAEAGLDQSIAEGSPVTLHGEASFDIDTDTFTYAWMQVGDSPTVTLTGANTASPTFVAPYVGTNGAPGVVATLVFELRVADGFPMDLPAPGYTFDNVVDTVTVQITNVNNLPTADAGDDQTVNENAAVALNATGSSDPDSDTLTYAWVQVGGPTVTVNGAGTAVLDFTAPFVSAGGAGLAFEVTVNDGYGGTSTDTVVVHVQNINDPPLASAARPTVAALWPPNHRMVAVGIAGVSDPNNNATIVITGVTQDEPTNGLGDGDTAIDAVINADGTVLLRAERSGNGDGRVYHIRFTASDFEGSTSGIVTVSVPHSVKRPVIDGGALFDSVR